MREIGHFIGGKAVKGSSGRFGDVFDPNTGEDELAFAEMAAGAIAADALALPPALGGLERRLLLAQLVRKWAAAPEVRGSSGIPLVAQTPAAACALADDLARLIDDMTMRGVGNVGPRGGPAGDILVVFEVEEDPRFERDGEDLYTEVLVTYPQLAIGANVQVPMVAGTVTLQVPPGTQSGQVFNLRGRGLPRINASSTGDLHVRLQMWTPDTYSDEEAALIRRLLEIQKVPESRPKGLWSKLKESLGA